MKRQRFLALFVALVGVGLAWGILDSQWKPMERPASAQAEVWQGNASINSFAPADSHVRHAAALAIKEQLTAFRNGDYQTALKYQSDRLRRHFQSAEQFQLMMTATYPEFAHYRSINIKDARSDALGNHVIMHVTLVGQDGVAVDAAYLLVKSGSQYRIEGVIGGNAQKPATDVAERRMRSSSQQPATT